MLGKGHNPLSTSHSHATTIPYLSTLTLEGGRERGRKGGGWTQYGHQEQDGITLTTVDTNGSPNDHDIFKKGADNVGKSLLS